MKLEVESLTKYWNTLGGSSSNKMPKIEFYGSILQYHNFPSPQDGTMLILKHPFFSVAVGWVMRDIGALPEFEDVLSWSREALEGLINQEDKTNA